MDTPLSYMDSVVLCRMRERRTTLRVTCDRRLRRGQRSRFSVVATVSSMSVKRCAVFKIRSIIDLHVSLSLLAKWCSNKLVLYRFIIRRKSRCHTLRCVHCRLSHACLVRYCFDKLHSSPTHTRQLLITNAPFLFNSIKFLLFAVYSSVK